MPIEVARMDRPATAWNGTPNPSSSPTAEVPSRVKSERVSPGARANSPSADRLTDPALSYAIPTASISSADANPSNLFDTDSTSALLGDSDHAGLNPTPALAAQARSSPAGAILHGPGALATTGAPAVAATALAMQPAQSTPAGGAATALSTAVGQSLSDGIRPMVMAPATTETSGPRRAHTPGSISPDGGSGGGGPPNGTPPTLTSNTFGIQPTGQPGKYQTATPIPIGAVAGLTATLTGTTEWSWSGGTYTGYFSKPANAPPDPLSQPAPTTPVGNTDKYGFIVAQQANPQYTVTCKATYPNGSGTATLTFTSVAPTGSLAVKQPGSQKVDPTGAVEVDQNDPIRLSASFSVGPYTGGTFMFMQILISDVSSYVDANNNAWHISNTANFTGFNGPLLDSPNTRYAYWGYYDGGYDFSWQLPDSNGGTQIPAPGQQDPFMSDSPITLAADPATDKTLSTNDSFAAYLMYQPGIQGSVWIAISQITWSWNETGTNNGQGRWAGPTQDLTPSDPNAPSGAAQFPYGAGGGQNAWVNTSGNYLQLYKSQWQGKQ